MRPVVSIYPSGAPGAGLLLLRLGVGQWLVAEALSGGPSWQRVAAAVLAAGILAGLLARPCAGLAFLLAGWAAASSPGPLGSGVSLLFETAALSLLGPGAYSLDARLFGRRTVVLTSPGADQPL